MSDFPLLDRILAPWLRRKLITPEQADAVSAYNAGRPTIDNHDKYVRPILAWPAGYRVTGL